jgi:hypothetical protein
MQVMLTRDEKGYHFQGDGYTVNDLARMIDIIEEAIKSSIVADMKDVVHERVMKIIEEINAVA